MTNFFPHNLHRKRRLGLDYRYAIRIIRIVSSIFLQLCTSDVIASGRML